MGIRRLVGIGVVASAFYLVTASPAAAGCCEQPHQVCCETPNISCCDTANDPVAEAVLFPKVPTPSPVRESMVVWFQRPVKIGNQILFGKYVIEHDNARLARGEPCTYIYAEEIARRR